jgi:predicted ATPase
MQYAPNMSSATSSSGTTPPTLITLFTGFLGAGKTSIITQLVRQRSGERIVLLKNEFGEAHVDSALAAVDSISVVEVCWEQCRVGRT